MDGWMKIASVLKVFSDSASLKQEGSSEKCCFTIKPSFLELAEKSRNAVCNSSCLLF